MTTNIRKAVISRISGAKGAFTTVTLEDGYSCTFVGRLTKGEAVRNAEYQRGTSLPSDLREGHDSSIACKHRDISVCDACAKFYAPKLVDVYGQHFWCPTEQERNQIAAALGLSKAAS